MRGGVVVVEIVDTVAPLGRPAVALEDLFKGGSGIGVGRIERGSVEQDGQTFVVGHPAVPGEVEEFGLLGTLEGRRGGQAECSENGIEMAAVDEAHRLLFFHFSGAKRA